MDLRPFQSDLVDRLRRVHQDHHGIVLQLPTGAGKTVLAVEVCRMIHSVHGRVAVVVHRDELVSQWLETAKKFGLRAGVVAAKWPRNADPWAPLQICMVQTLARRKKPLPWTPDYLLIDEAHLGAAESYLKVIRRWPTPRRLGLTATPWRLDGGGFPWATTLMEGPSIRDLVGDGYLVPFKTYSIPMLNYKDLRVRMGEFTSASQSQQYESQPLVGGVSDNLRKYAGDRSAIVFASSVKHSRALAAEIGKWTTAEHLDGETPTVERKAILGRLESGETMVVCNVGVCTEGLDVRRVSAISVARATLSLSLWRQMAGRALRTLEGKKDAVILDHGGCALRHGNLDYPMEWSIAARTKKEAGEAVPRAKLCGACAAVMPAHAAVCSVCGGELLIKERRVRLVKGELVELPPESAPITSPDGKMRRARPCPPGVTGQDWEEAERARIRAGRHWRWSYHQVGVQPPGLQFVQTPPCSRVRKWTRRWA